MLLLPLGVEAKTVDVPWATIIIVVCTTFYSVLNMGVSQRFQESYFELPERRAYQTELKTYLQNDCPNYLKSETCKSFSENVMPEQLVSTELVASRIPEVKKDRTEAKNLETFLKPFMETSQVSKLDATGAGFSKLKERLKLFESASAQIVRKERLYSDSNAGIVPLIRAQFLHGGWMHLIGNLLFLLLLAIPVEQRVGPARFAGIYILTGLFGLWFQARLGGGEYILGASACVFGIAGAFVAFFAKQQMRVWVTFFFITHRVVLMPVLIYFGFWVVANEVIGLTEQSNVAHAAHLAGFVSGFLLGLIDQKFSPLPMGLTYGYEFQFLKRAEKEKAAKKQLLIFKHWLSLNPASHQAGLGLLKSLHQNRLSEAKAGASVVIESEILWPLVSQNIGSEELLRELPLDLLAHSPVSFDRERLGRALKKAHDEKREISEWVLLLPLLDTSEGQMGVFVEKRFGELNVKVLGDEEFVNHLQELAALNPEFRQRLEARGVWMGIARSSYG